MKVEEKRAAIALRLQGRSIQEIASSLGVAKSTVSLWVRDTPLTARQRRTINARGHSIDAIEKRRLARISDTRKRRKVLMDTAGVMIERVTPHELWMLGIALYWGEGGKAYFGSVRLANSDPAVIQVMMRFFRKICEVPEEKFRGHVNTFSHRNVEAAERYWSRVSRIPRKRFYRTYVKKSIASKHKRGTLPYGTFQIYISDTKLFFTIMGWIERIKFLTQSSK
jgi:hypothetical protein